MRKQWAIEQLGGAVSTTAAECRVTASAVSQWPDELPKDIEDRVLAALARKHLPPELIGAEGAPNVPEADAVAGARAVAA